MFIDEDGLILLRKVVLVIVYLNLGFICFLVLVVWDFFALLNSKYKPLQTASILTD